MCVLEPGSVWGGQRGLLMGRCTEAKNKSGEEEGKECAGLKKCHVVALSQEEM